MEAPIAVGDIVRTWWGNGALHGLTLYNNGVIVRVQDAWAMVEGAASVYTDRQRWPDRAPMVTTETDHFMVRELQPVKNPSRIRDELVRAYLVKRQAELRAVEETSHAT